MKAAALAALALCAAACSKASPPPTEAWYSITVDETLWRGAEVVLGPAHEMLRGSSVAEASLTVPLDAPLAADALLLRYATPCGPRDERLAITLTAEEERKQRARGKSFMLTVKMPPYKGRRVYAVSPGVRIGSFEAEPGAAGAILMGLDCAASHAVTKDGSELPRFVTPTEGFEYAALFVGDPGSCYTLRSVTYGSADPEFAPMRLDGGRVQILPTNQIDFFLRRADSGVETSLPSATRTELTFGC